MAGWQQLQSELQNLLINGKVYYDPPESIRMTYPAIQFKRTKYESTFANNQPYQIRNRYEATLIDYQSDNPVINEILRLPYCTHDRSYVADNLHHDVFIIYY